MNRQSLINQLDEYLTLFPEEKEYIPKFKTLLRKELCYLRELTSGHLTASAWIVNQEQSAVLMLHHKKLDRWLQPGGHADGEEDLIAVARKEVAEETGLSDLTLHCTEIFDLDIHEIPERSDVPAHDHFDVRFCFVADADEVIKGNHESNDITWVPLNQLEKYVGEERSILRMREKTFLSAD